MDLILNVQLLGEFRLALGDEVLRDVNTPRLKSLLAYLLLHQTSPQSRQQLAYLYWPDSNESQAHNNLRQSFHRLRLALPNPDRYLYSDAQSVQWVSDSRFTLDVDEFNKAVASADEINGLIFAANLYQGELLSDCYDDWILTEREHLQQKYHLVLDQLITLLEEQRDYRSAIHYAQRLLRSDPLREETYRQLIHLYFMSGNRTGAIRAYHTCVRVLKCELDVDPSAETEQFFKEAQKSFAKPSLPNSSKLKNHHLPVYLTSFIGREGELNQLKLMLSRREAHTYKARLITLLGPGGCGKTRLAVQLAGNVRNEYRDGVWFIDIATLSSPDFLLNAIASALDLQEHPEANLLLAIKQYLEAKECLLFFDNCESMTSACTTVIQSLIVDCPELQVLVTSREKLNLDGEITWQVAPLSLPEGKDATMGTIARSDAGRLFIERATSVLPTFTINPQNAAAIHQICRRLDGLPLAIELAAARITLLTPDQIANRLDSTFDLLARGGSSIPLRHQTLRATLDWSYFLLSEKERTLFQRLSVFSGSFTLNDVENVCADPGGEGYLPPTEILDLLAHLLDKSMVFVSDWKNGDQLRYRLLAPTYQYADERLRQSGDWELLHQRHLAYFIRYSEEAESHFTHFEQAEWFDRLLSEHDNLMAAIHWSLQLEDQTYTLHLLATLWYYWLARGFYQEGLKLIIQSLDATRGDQPSIARTRALQMAGSLYLWVQGDCSRARPLLEEAVELSRNLRDQKNLASSLSTLGAVALTQGDYPAALASLIESLALQTPDDTHGIGWTCAYLGDLFMNQNDLDQAASYFEKSIDLFRANGDINSLAYPTRRSGFIAMKKGDLQRAVLLFKDSLRMNIQINYIKGTAACLIALSGVALEQGNYLRSANLIGLAEKTLHAATGKLFQPDQEVYETIREALSAHLDPIVLNAARAEGHAIEIDSVAKS